MMISRVTRTRFRLALQRLHGLLMRVAAKLDQFRHESRFTTWAYRCVILEVSAKLGRHFWRSPDLSIDEEDWDRLPESFGLDPQRRAEWQELIDALPELDPNRNAIYKSLFDARRKLRQTLVANGYMNPETEDSR